MCKAVWIDSLQAITKKDGHFLEAPILGSKKPDEDGAVDYPSFPILLKQLVTPLSNCLIDVQLLLDRIT